MKQTLILIAALLPISAIACNNQCWYNATGPNGGQTNAEKVAAIRNPSPHLIRVIDRICVQGRAITAEEIDVQQTYHFAHPVQCYQPTPTPTPHATPTPSATPTATATATASVHPTPSPTASSTPTPRPSPTPTPHIRPTPTPTPKPTPTVTPGCVWARYWWCHPELWCFETLQLGNNSYTSDQVLQIVEGQPGNNGLIILAKQLISTKLNLQCNHTEADCIRQTVNDADFTIGDLVIPPIGDGFLTQGSTNNLVMILLNYNQGRACAPPCADPPCELPTPTP